MRRYFGKFLIVTPFIGIKRYLPHRRQLAGIFKDWYHQKCSIITRIKLMTAAFLLLLFVAKISYLSSNGSNLRDTRSLFANKTIDEDDILLTGGSLFIEIISSQSKVSVSIEGSVVYENAERTSGKGIHVLVLNQATGSIMAKRLFDTYSTRENESLTHFFNAISVGRIIIFAVKDEGTFQMNQLTRNTLRNLGSKVVEDLGWRDMWAMIAKKGGKNYGESHSKSSSTHMWGVPVYLQVHLPMVPYKESECNWPLTEENERRKAFCNHIEGYGDVCSCTNPSPITFQPRGVPDNKVINVPVVVIASNRPHFLYRMLVSLLKADGVNMNMITVYVDGYYEEPFRITKLLGVRAVQNFPIGTAKSRIMHSMKVSISSNLKHFPYSKNIIVLLENADISVDIFSYFSQTIDLLDADPSLFCISAWNDLGYENTSEDIENLYRVETVPGFGWMIKKSLFVKELEPNWPSIRKHWNFDVWMGIPAIRKKRECVVPEVSRIRQLFDSSDANSRHYGTRTYNVKPLVTLKNVEDVIKGKYEFVVKNFVKKGLVLDHSKNPCENNFVPSIKGSVFLIFIKMENSKDFVTWLQIAKCFHIWDVDSRGYHNGMWRLRIKGSETLVIGVPYSIYSKYKPANITPIYIQPRSKFGNDS